ncbi:hypothetical protein [Bifidobacterium crudilactis]|jgi:hypothetical protein|uniref:hypothetical protein n=1 Tax=Bifidobacterium crudilactis TaxID=327277 RepID=UPI002357196A|nr:hypothetical protein [Bifidobacterium crudilactis]MCI1217956.1 hypothetical protein [Bifidobacterium crudilactis]
MKDSLTISPILISFVALCISIIVFWKTQRRARYEHNRQHFAEILSWHNQVIEVLMELKILSVEERPIRLAKLSALIESGRFYFPNLDRKDNFGAEKPWAYQGYRNVILDFLVFEYEIFSGRDIKNNLEYSDVFRRLFTSYVFKHLGTQQQTREIQKNTDIGKGKPMSLEDFLEKSPDELNSYFMAKMN